ncbi:MAG TPA: NAD(P)-dependent oxidoreductase [Terriglobales bacterium]|nr:NAD(P)-dependent oxidoreductase [Terriglobales bacterium]
MTKPRVAFLGLGTMGTGMARRLLAAGFPLTVYNRNPERSKGFENVATSPKDAASRADIVISMVADDAASRSMWLGERGALAGAAKGSLLIESGTLTVGWIKELAAAAKAKDCEFLDAPVTGTKPHAAAGELIFLVGGTEAALEKARPAFSAMGKEVVHLGPNGSGALMKLVNNVMAGVQAASFAEALALADGAGLDHAKVVSILSNGAPGSPLVKRVAAIEASGDFTPNFTLRLMAKDLGYASGEAERHGIKFRTAAAAIEVLKKAIADGYGEEDFAAVVKSFRKN